MHNLQAPRLSMNIYLRDVQLYLQSALLWFPRMIDNVSVGTRRPSQKQFRLTTKICQSISPSPKWRIGENIKNTEAYIKIRFLERKNVEFEQTRDYAANGILYRRDSVENKMRDKPKLLKIWLLWDVTPLRLVNT
jgi:hypothetical protein